MRLGQLARKLTIRQQEIVDFFASQNITIEDNSNSRLSDDQVALIISRFASSPLNNEPSAPRPEPIQEQPAGDDLKDESPVIDVVETASSVEKSDVESEIPELIKAPKIELQGLKVLGKIALPETKKKDDAVQEKLPATESTDTGKRRQRTEERPNGSKRRNDIRPGKNPIAQAREREAEEMKRKQREQAEQAKEKRTQNYHKRIKTAPPTKRARLIDEQVEDLPTNEASKPTGLWGKIRHWFKT